MIKKSLYLVTGIKRYPAFTGDNNTEYVKLLVPADSASEAWDSVKKNQPNIIDEFKGSRKLYDVTEGTVKVDGFWEIGYGFEEGTIINLAY